MTVSSLVSKVTVAGNGSATTFSFSPMVIQASGDIVVTYVASNGTETTLVEGTGPTQYAVVVSSYPGTGSIRYPEAGGTPVPTGASIVIKRTLSFLQETDLNNQGGYFADVQETAFDRAAMRDIQIQEQVDRSVRVPVGEASLTTPVLPNTTIASAGDVISLGVGKTSLAWVAGAGTLPDPVTVDRGGTGAATASAAMINLGETTEVDVASAATCDIGAAASRNVRITGTTTITSLGTVAAGTWRVVRFEGTLTLTHNANILILPGEKNITTAAGDSMICASRGTGIWKVHVYQAATTAGMQTLAGLSSFAQTLVDDTTAATARATLGATGNVKSVQTFTANGTWTRPTACVAILVIAKGGGGGGGGGSGAADNKCSGGGGEGETVWKFVDVSALASASVAIGAAGAAGASTGGNGGNGGDTTFNSTTVVAKGGTGGTGSTAAGYAAGGAGGSGGTGDLMLAGQSGGGAVCATGVNILIGGYGGHGPAGNQAADGISAGANSGNGGGGGARGSGASFTGGAGGNGVMLILEMY